ncbi:MULTISPECIES: hypothetical protein [unclassified Flavobacterium]|uniref:hypothetical protein n=1 Tax=unclassified Flavobacterium TaxID=196869 RepID=UPI00131D5CD9|nr:MULTISPECIES: hypothetical protein [unclassified Flavobacterium]
MKKIVFLLLASILFVSCWPPNEPNEIPRQEYQPVIITRSALETSIAFQNAQPIVKSGKIYIKGDLMFINDVNKGFHVYDYANPSKPERLYFIKAPGATDLAIKGNTVYINQAVDLVTATFDPDTKIFKVTNRNKNVFPQKQAPNGTFGYTKDSEIIIDWNLKK